jgi:circadian clock protein KaiB
MPQEPDMSPLSFEVAAARRSRPDVVLQLYVAGTNPRSLRAVERVSRLCQEHLLGHYQLEVIDIYLQPERAQEGQVIAAPTLVRSAPTPLRQIVGDMSDDRSLRRALQIPEAA